MNDDSTVRGPHPLLVTPWAEDGRLDAEVLVREAEARKWARSALSSCV